jgi:cysteine desulfurase
MIYLDNQANTPCDPRVLEAMAPFWHRLYGNPHSVEHGRGLVLAGKVEEARGQLAEAIAADLREVIFTSGATEANNLAIKGVALFAQRHASGAGTARRKILTLASEHKCVLESVKATAAWGFEPVILPVQSDGLIDWPAFEAALDDQVLLVSVMAVNNETGVIQPIADIAEKAHAVGAKLHCDAAQALGKIPLDVGNLGVDLMSLSAHKAYGPMGIGALFVRRRPRMRIEPLLSGGNQERGLRSGTLPLPLVVGFGLAAKLAADEQAPDAQRLATWQQACLDVIAQRGNLLKVNGSVTQRIAHNLNVSFLKLDREAMLRAWTGFAVSSGSACSAADVEPSYVLTSMGVAPEQAAASLRIAFGRHTRQAEVDQVLALLASSALADA